MILWGVLASAILFLTGFSRAETQAPYALHPQREWILLGTGSALGVGSLVLKSQIDPLTVEEIDRLNLDDVNSFDRRSVYPYRRDEVGDLLLVGSYAIPLTLLASSEMRRDWRTLAVMWTETTLLQLGTAGIVKTTVKRTRPYAYVPDTPLDKKMSRSARMSFFSGHTTQTAANCFFAAKVFSDYSRNKRAKIVVWSGAALYPVIVGVQRRKTGHHFNTDTIVGYCAGALVGYFVPELHRVRGAEFLQPTVIQGGVGLGVRVGFR